MYACLYDLLMIVQVIEVLDSAKSRMNVDK